ncbi:MAG: hypothetical protein D6751_10535, partial [Deltaproteobacteria bacterium]
LLESLPPLFDRPFSGTLTVQDLDGVGDERTTPRLRFDIEDIVAACNRFYRPIFDRELALLRQRGFVDADWANRIERLLQRLQPAFDARRTFLLRVGRHSGAEAVTLEGVRSIRIMKGRGEKPGWSDSPKTLWLAGYERQAQRNLLPFGWLLVEIDPDSDSPVQAGDTVRSIQEWQRRVHERIAKLRDKADRAKAEAEARFRAEEEERRQREAEEAARRKEEEEEAARRQAEFDALPEWEKAYRAIETQLAGFPETLTKDRYPELVGMLNSYLEQAKAWPDDARAKAADQIESAYDRFGWGIPGQPSKKKKKQEQKKRQQLDALRTGNF